MGGLCARALVAVTNHDHEYTCRKKHNHCAGRTMEGKCTVEGLRTGRIHNIRRSNKSQHPIPVAFYAALVLPGYPEERGGAWRCVGESKKRKEGGTRLVLFAQACDIFVKRRCTYLCIYAISDIFRFICSPKNLMEFNDL